MRGQIKQRVLELAAQGLTPREIATVIGRSYQQVRGYLVQAGIWEAVKEGRYGRKEEAAEGVEQDVQAEG